LNSVLGFGVPPALLERRAETGYLPITREIQTGLQRADVGFRNFCDFGESFHVAHGDVG